jgi:hypothetical protein
MLELFKDNPWLVVVTLALLIPILGIVFGSITRHLTTVKLAEIDANLKQDMLNRGMSAEDIKTVVEATPRRKGRKCETEPTALP